MDLKSLQNLYLCNQNSAQVAVRILPKSEGQNLITMLSNRFYKFERKSCKNFHFSLYLSKIFTHDFKNRYKNRSIFLVIYNKSRLFLKPKNRFFRPLFSKHFYKNRNNKTTKNDENKRKSCNFFFFFFLFFYIFLKRKRIYIKRTRIQEIQEN